MLKRLSLIISIFLSYFSFLTADTHSGYESGKIVSGYEKAYDTFIRKKLDILRNSSSPGIPIEFEIHISKIGKYPSIFSHEFIIPLSTLEDRYMEFRKRKYENNKSVYEDRFLQQQQRIKDMYEDFTENTSNKEYLIVMGVVKQDHEYKFTKDKYVLLINPEDPTKDWKAWLINPNTQKNTALILTSVDGNSLEFLNTPYRDFDILAERYDDPMYKFILEPLYDNAAKENPFPF